MPPVSKPSKPRHEPGALSYAEEKVLRAARDLPVFSAKDITHLLSAKGSQGSYYRALLKKLCGGADGKNNAYLYRFTRPHTTGNARRFYTLTRRGAAMLRDLGVEADYWYRSWKASHYSFSFMQHHHAVSQFIVGLQAFVRHTDNPAYQVIELRTGFSIARKAPCLMLGADGQETSIPVIPDAWVYIERSEGTPPKIQGFSLWIEVYFGTETKTKFQQLVLNSINFIRFKGYETYFGTPALLCCYLAVGATMDYRIARLHTMRTWTAEVLAGEQLDKWAALFRFSTIDECLYDTLMIFTDPAWYLVGSDTLVRLFPPSHEQEEADGNSTTTPYY
jgi:Replication-relaxation